MKRFDEWNKVKKDLESSIAINTFPKEGEVWMTYYGLNLGYEQDGSKDYFSRPILVIKKFNNKMFWVVPLSTKQKKIDFYFNFTDHNGQNVSAILAQLKLISVKRMSRKMYQIDDTLLDCIKYLIIKLI